MLFHLYNHEGNDNEDSENGARTIYDHLHWRRDFLDRILDKLKKKDFVVEEAGVLKLTDSGRQHTIESYEKIVASLNSE